MMDNKVTKKEEKVIVSVKLTPEQKRRLRIIMASENITISDWMGNLIDEAFESLDDRK